MAWLRVDDGFDTHPKILGLGSDQRRWTWARILVYTCRYRSPSIPANIAETIPRATRQFLRECVELGLVDATDQGYEVHDWDNYNGADSRMQIRERVRKHRAQAAERNGDERYDSDTEALHQPLPKRYSRAGTRARPVPSRPNPPPTPPQQEEQPHTNLHPWDTTKRNAAHQAGDTDRAQAWIHHAQTDPKVRNTVAVSWNGYQTGDWPPTTRPEIAPGAQGTRSTSPPLPDREPEPEPERIAPPPEFAALAGRKPARARPQPTRKEPKL